METAVIVQARINSSRLPNKIFNSVGGWPLLRHVLWRCKQIRHVQTVICAIPDTDDPSKFREICDLEGVVVVQGPEQDVLSRYLRAAGASDVIMRVTSDCPLIDPAVCGTVMDRILEGDVDYACNNMPSSFPHGLDCEAFTLEALQRAADLATDGYDREHVTPFMRRDESFRRANILCEQPEWKDLRLTLDFPEDLEFFRRVEEFKPLRDLLSFEDLVDFFTDRPTLTAINADRRVVR